MAKRTKGVWHYERVVQRVLVKGDLGFFPLRIGSLEGLLVLKVASFRQKDRRGILAVLASLVMGSCLDRGYIE